MSSPLSCWVISDGRRGIENQALGLAEAISRLHPVSIERKVLSSSGVFKAAQPGMQLAFKSKPGKFGLDAPFPKLAIGCGRQAIAPLRALKKTCGADIFTVYIQDPRTKTAHFDLVIAPEHDQLKGENVFSIIGSPNRVSNDRIVVETLKFDKPLAALKPPRVAMLIGGNSKTHILDEKSHAAHLETANLARSLGYSLMVTTSRRTPQFVQDAYQKLASQNVRVWYDDGQGENPFFAMLGASDAILVTEDSTNMLTEACATGKPVFTLPMKGEPGKFQQLYDRLRDRCNLARSSDNFQGVTYTPLNETKRAAEEVIRRLEIT